MKDVTLQLVVRVDEDVEDNAVAQQIGDAIDPDAWNWDVGYPRVVASRPVRRSRRVELATRHHGERISLAMHQFAERTRNDIAIMEAGT